VGQLLRRPGDRAARELRARAFEGWRQGRLVPQQDCLHRCAAHHHAFLERRDELRVPFFSWGREYQFMPAVEVHATEMLNLLRNDWLRRPPLPLELAIFGCSALLAGFGLIRFRPLIATCLAVTGALLAVIVSAAFFGNEQIWFPWMVVVGAQLPVDLRGALFSSHLTGMRNGAGSNRNAASPTSRSANRPPCSIKPRTRSSPTTWIGERLFGTKAPSGFTAGKPRRCSTNPRKLHFER